MAPRRSHRFAICAVALCAAVLLTACSDPVRPNPAPPELIVFSNLGDIFVIEPDGSGLVQLTTGILAHFPVWSPDGERIAFGGEVDGEWRIYVMEADGTNLQMVKGGLTEFTWTEWAPDGMRIVFNVDAELHVLDLSEGNQMSLFQCDIGCSHASRSPDGSGIALVGRPDRGNLSAFPLVHILSADGSASTLLGTGLLYEHFPSWSPDGSKVQFVGSADLGSFDIYTARPDGTELVNITNGGGAGPAGFSRDGSSLVYFQSGPSASDGQDALYIINADGSGRRKIASLPAMSFSRPRWRP